MQRRYSLPHPFFSFLLLPHLARRGPQHGHMNVTRRGCRQQRAVTTRPAPFIGATPLIWHYWDSIFFVLHLCVMYSVVVISLQNNTYLTPMDPEMTKYDRNGPANYPVKWPEVMPRWLTMTQIGLRMTSKNDPSWPEFDLNLTFSWVIRLSLRVPNLANMSF